MKRTTAAPLLFTVAALVTTSATAQANTLYGGIALGKATVDSGVRPVPETASFFSPPDTLTVDQARFNAHDTAWGAFAGAQITDQIGLEVGYWNHGTFASSTTNTDTGRLSMEELFIGATLRYPFATRFALTGSIGISRAHFAVTGSNTVRIPDPAPPPVQLPFEIPDDLQVPLTTPNDETGTYWNVGVNMQLPGNLLAGLSYGTRDLRVERVKLGALSLLYTF